VSNNKIKYESLNEDYHSYARRSVNTHNKLTTKGGAIKSTLDLMLNGQQNFTRFLESVHKDNVIGRK